MTEETLEAQVQAILRRPYHRVITGEPVEGYLGEVPELPGCLTAGETPEQAVRNLEEAMAVWVESALMHGDPIPEPAAGPVRLSA
jgi:predicted RNase H-like HicB family nuclease